MSRHEILDAPNTNHNKETTAADEPLWSISRFPKARHPGGESWQGVGARRPQPLEVIMVRIEIGDSQGRSFGRTTGIENCYKALRDAGVVRYSINTVGEAITKYFAGQAQDCTICPHEHYELMGVQMRDGTVGTVRLWCDQLTAEVEA